MSLEQHSPLFLQNSAPAPRLTDSRSQSPSFLKSLVLDRHKTGAKWQGYTEIEPNGD